MDILTKQTRSQAHPRQNSENWFPRFEDFELRRKNKQRTMGKRGKG